MARRKSQRRAPARAEKAKRGRERGGRDGGARPFWSGTISFGLVTVPVDLFSSARSAAPPMRMLAPDGAPLERRYYCPDEERDLGWDEIARGYEVAEDEYVLVTDEELEAAAPRKSRDIDLRLFVDAAELDPFLFERAYVLTPGGESTKPYRLLAAVMGREGKAGIATFVMRDKEYLVAIVARDGILWAETLRFADELRPAEEVGLGEPVRGSKPLVDGFRKAIRGLEAKGVEREELADERIDRLRTLVEEKRKHGKDVVQSPRAPAKGKQRPADADEDAGEPPDLFETIRRNLSGEAGAPAASRPAKKKGKPTASKGPAPELAALSKRELYERARELDLAGRSEMTKDELIRALRK